MREIWGLHPAQAVFLAEFYSNPGVFLADNGSADFHDDPSVFLSGLWPYFDFHGYLSAYLRSDTELLVSYKKRSLRRDVLAHGRHGSFARYIMFMRHPKNRQGVHAKSFYGSFLWTVIIRGSLWRTPLVSFVGFHASKYATTVPSNKIDIILCNEKNYYHLL